MPFSGQVTHGNAAQFTARADAPRTYPLRNRLAHLAQAVSAQASQRPPQAVVGEMGRRLFDRQPLSLEEQRQLHFIAAKALEEVEWQRFFAEQVLHLVRPLKDAWSTYCEIVHTGGQTTMASTTLGARMANFAAHYETIDPEYAQQRAAQADLRRWGGMR